MFKCFLNNNKEIVDFKKLNNQKKLVFTYFCRVSGLFTQMSGQGSLAGARLHCPVHGALCSIRASKSCQHNGRGSIPGQMSTRAAGTVQTKDYLATEATEGTGGVVSQQKPDTAFRSTLSGRSSQLPNKKKRVWSVRLLGLVTW